MNEKCGCGYFPQPKPEDIVYKVCNIRTTYCNGLAKEQFSAIETVTGE